jgi:hypothetical protein
VPLVATGLLEEPSFRMILIASSSFLEVIGVMFKFPNPFDEIMKKMQESNQRLIESATKPITDMVSNLAHPPEFKMPTFEFEMPKFEFEPPQFDIPNVAETIIRESTRGIEEAIDRFNPMLAKASAVMARHGWWLVRQLPLSFYSDVANHDEEVTREVITNYILAYFSQNQWERLAKMVDGWNFNGFSSRREHFQDALEVHRQGRYTMTVPGLVFQVEGIVREFILTTDNFTHHRFEPVRRIFQEKFDQLNAIPQDRKITYEDVELIENYHNLAVLGRLYDTYRPEEGQAPETVNRHAIGHGLWTGYNTVEASTYLFLILDMLHAMMKQLARDDEFRELLQQGE